MKWSLSGSKDIPTYHNYVKFAKPNALQVNDMILNDQSEWENKTKEMLTRKAEKLALSV